MDMFFGGYDEKSCRNTGSIIFWKMFINSCDSGSFGNGCTGMSFTNGCTNAQTGYPSFFYEDFTSKMNYFTEEWSKLNVTFDGITTGFVTGEEQIYNIFQFLDKFYTRETVLLVDPVMGDIGEVYKLFTDELLVLMRELVKRADVITPNVTECCLLTGSSYAKLHSYSNEKDYLKAIEEAGNMFAARNWRTGNHYWNESTVSRWGSAFYRKYVFGWK